VSTGVTSYSVNLGWANNANGNSVDATATQVEYSPTGANTWTVLTSTLAPSATTYTASGLARGTGYDFRVKTITSAVSSDYATLTDVVTSSVIPPAAPTSFSGSVSGATSQMVNLSWVLSPTATGYTVEESIAGSNVWTVLTSTLSATATSYSVSGLNSGTSYQFEVIATNAGGASPVATVTMTIPAASSDTPTMPTWALVVLALLLAVASRDWIRASRSGT
jgi:hypothetical protein